MRFGKQILGAAGRIPGAKTASRRGKQITRRALSGKTVAPVLSRIPGSRATLFNKGLYSLDAKSITTGVRADGSLAAKRITAGAAAKRNAKIGKPDFFPRVSAMSHGSKRVIGTGALLGVSAAGFSSGFDSQNQVSNSMYNLAFGNPDYDKYVMGRKMGVRSLMAPFPGETRMMAYTPRAYSDAWRASRKQQPKVDGSIAFGMYNSRLG